MNEPERNTYFFETVLPRKEKEKEGRGRARRRRGGKGGGGGRRSSRSSSLSSTRKNIFFSLICQKRERKKTLTSLFPCPVFLFSINARQPSCPRRSSWPSRLSSLRRSRSGGRGSTARSGRATRRRCSKARRSSAGCSSLPRFVCLSLSFFPFLLHIDCALERLKDHICLSVYVDWEKAAFCRRRAKNKTTTTMPI